MKRKRGKQIGWIVSLGIGVWGLLGATPALALQTVIDVIPEAQPFDCDSDDPTVRNHPALQYLCRGMSTTQSSHSAPEQKLLDGYAQIADSYHRLLSYYPRGSRLRQREMATQWEFLHALDSCQDDSRCLAGRLQQRNAQLTKALQRIRFFPEAELERITRGWKTATGEKLSDRILRGLGAYDIDSTHRVALDDGYVALWGNQTPNISSTQSLTILDSAGHIAALVAADDLADTEIAHDPKDSKGRVTIYVPQAGGLGAVLPIVYSWSLADRLGFDLDCNGQDRKYCEKYRELPGRPPMLAYDLGCASKDREQCQLPVVWRPSISTPFDVFRRYQK